METVDIPRLTKARLKALERVFAAEIEGRLPLYSKARIYNEMAADGLVEFQTFNLGKDRFGVIKVSGWSLTHAGRIAYCMSCRDVPEPSDGAGESNA